MGLLRGPDGQIVNLPDEQVGSAIASGYEPVSLGAAADTTAALPKQDTGLTGDLGAAASSFLSGATLGTSDLALKHILPPAGYKQLAEDREDHPWISGAGQLVGTIAPSLASGGTLTPAGYLSSVTQEAAEGGLGKSLVAAGFEGATQNAGAYLADAALGDRDATAEGMVGALGTGFAFGAGGGAAAHGVEAGTIAARRMFARVMDGGPEAAQAAEQAWKSTSQEVLEAHDQAAEIAKAKLAAARTAREQAAVARDQASAGLAEAKLAAPGLDAEHAAAVGLDQAIGKVPDDLAAFVQQAANPPGGASVPVMMTNRMRSRLAELGHTADEIANMTPSQAWDAINAGPKVSTAGDVESLHDLAQKVDAYTAARRELDEMMARVEPDHELEDAMGRFEVPSQVQTAAGDVEGGVPRGEFGEPGQGGFKSQNELGRLAAERGDLALAGDQSPLSSSVDVTKASRPKAIPVAEPSPSHTSATPMSDDEFNHFAEKERSTLDDEAKEALHNYSAQGLFGQINSALRQFASTPRLLENLDYGGDPLKFLEADIYGGYKAKATRAIDRGIAASVSPRDIVVYRGVRGRGFKAVENLRPGSSFVEHGYSSTSISPEVGADYVKGFGNGNGAELRITVPAGYPAAPIPSEFEKERELLLPRDSKYTVTRREIADDGHLILHVTVGAAEPAEAASSLPLHADNFAHSAGGADDIGPASRAEESSHGTGAGADSIGHMSADDLGPRPSGADDLGSFSTYENGVIPSYARLKSYIEDHGQELESLVPAGQLSEYGYYEPSSGKGGNERVARAEKAMREGQQTPVKLNISPTGKITVTDGRHRLDAAIKLDVPIRVQWSTGFEPAASDVPRWGAAKLGRVAEGSGIGAHVIESQNKIDDSNQATRSGLARGELGPLRPEPPTELEKLLQGTKSRLDSGEPLGKIASESPAREAYVLDKAATRERQAAEFRAAAVARRAAAEPETDLERALRGTKEGLDSGKSMRDLRMAKGTGEHPLAIKQLELAHDEALDRAAAAPDPVTRSQAMREAKAIEREMTKVGARPGAVEDVAAMAGVVTKVEKAGTELTEALGKDAPPTAQKAAAAYRDAESVAERKTLARTARAADDHAASIADAAPPAGKRPARMAEPQVIVDPATGSRHLVHPETGEISPPLGEGFKDRNPGPTGKSKIDEARATKLRADADLANARAAEGKARIEARTTARTAKDARAAAESGPVPNGRVKTSFGSKLVTAAKVAGAASALGIPGIPSVHDIPVIGPLLSAYIKYRTLKAAAGRFVGRVPATADARAAALAAKVKDAMARAVDRSLGLVERNQAAIRASMVAASAKAGEALQRRAIDDGHPNAPKGATTSELAAVRMREVAAAATDPSIVTKLVRSQMRDVIDPDLIAAAENHLIAMYKHLNDTAPKGPPPNPYTVKPWQPSPAEALQWARRLAVANDPRVALDALETQTLTPEAADTLRVVYPKLFAAAQQRIIQRAQDLTNPVPYRQLLQNSLLFDLSLVPSLDPTNAAILSQAHAKNAPAAPPMAAGSGGGQPSAPPVPSIANTTNISKLYQQTMADRPGMR